MKNIQQCVHRIVEEFLCPERLCSCTSVWHKKVSSCFEWDHIQIIQIFNAVFFRTHIPSHTFLWDGVLPYCPIYRQILSRCRTIHFSTGDEYTIGSDGGGDETGKRSSDRAHKLPRRRREEEGRGQAP